MRNLSMMTPMHLHDITFRSWGINGQVISGQCAKRSSCSVAFAFDAVNPGKAWAFHCHHLYHMATGMMTIVGDEGG